MSRGELDVEPDDKVSFTYIIFKAAEAFIELFRESIIIQGAITLLLATAVVILSMRGDNVPEVLQLSLATVLGFWFGSKKQVQSNIEQERVVRSALQAADKVKQESDENC